LLDKFRAQKESVSKPAEKIKEEEALKNEPDQNKNEIIVEDAEKKNGELETKQEIKEEDGSGEIKEEKEKEREIINLGENNKERELQQNRLDSIYQIKPNEGEYLLKIEKETIDRASALKKREEDKIKEIANLLVDMQINKLEAKITYLEEYERILWQERKQQEIFQKALIAERVALAQKRLEIEKMNTHGMLSEGKDMLQNIQQAQNINIDDMFSLGNNDKTEEFPKNEHF
jgi:SWIRM-associated region 1